MTQAEISGISPFFIVRHVPSSLSFYRDRLGFEIAFQGPAPDDIFFGIVRRGGAQILLKAVGVDPVPNYTRDVKKGGRRRLSPVFRSSSVMSEPRRSREEVCPYHPIR